MTLPTTPSQTVGPYYAIGLCRRPDNAPGEEISLAGVVYDGAGEAIGDAVVEVWDPVGRQWARSGTDSRGRFSFRLSKPRGDGDDAPRLDAYVFARGLLKHQLTRIYFPDEAEANERDPVLSSLPKSDRATLVASQDNGSLCFDIRMQGERATVFFGF